MSNPSEATLLVSSSAVSSNEIQMPGSPNSAAPRTRNSMPSSVLPHPGPPHTRLGRPRGSPPSVISSSPWMPVGHFGRGSKGFLDFEVLSFGERMSPPTPNVAEIVKCNAIRRADLRAQDQDEIIYLRRPSKRCDEIVGQSNE